ncbi:hypothetical protein IQ254_12540 [Nodosilinea sp. LEGE 07088]|uniref:hypothetical protein n=1 Tax=Nodosilinea sp. LEGE 07088 TaxID=2777968 RepID=UPI00187F1DC0|nr:hypothetical protein [Nodosilinea sp. LEGE 07088]MBE9138008.1 hypothetical protein [Nodosilinea sp. LEGE 07088]
MMIIYHAPAPLPYTPLKVAFVTGLSDPNSCSLSLLYRQFMAELDCLEAWKIYLNFPYIPGSNQPENTPILKAGLANWSQFLGARSPKYRAAIRFHLANIATSSERSFFIAGSCGLEILNQAWTAAIAPNQLHIMALGPVARTYSPMPCTMVQGSRDYISRYFFSQVDVLVPGVNHMGYVQNADVFALVNAQLRHVVSSL